MGLRGRQHSCAMLILFKGLACGVCVAYFNFLFKKLKYYCYVFLKLNYFFI